MISRHERRLAVRPVLALATTLGTALGVLSAACGDFDGTPVTSGADASPDAPNVSPESGPDATNAIDASDASDGGSAPDPRGPFDPADVPVVCGTSPCATQIVAGNDHFCARMSDGTVRCWGAEDMFGALGPNFPEEGSTVRAIADIEGVKQLSAAGATICALLDKGEVACWGDNRRAQLGLELEPLADEGAHPTPMLVPLDSAATRVDVGHGVVCAHLASGRLSCWGSDDQGQLLRNANDGDPYPDRMRRPGLAVTDPLSFARVAASNYSMLGIAADGTAWSWGALAGDLGTVSGRLGSISPSLTPKRLDGLSNVTSLVASVWIARDAPSGTSRPAPGGDTPKLPPQAHACVIADGEVHCWGRSYQGALCTGVRDDQFEPARAPLPSSAKTWAQQLAVADEITCARTTDGSVYCCGGDEHGKLGTGAVGILSASFIKADAFKGHAVQVATSNHAVCALVVDGTVECWGSNERESSAKRPTSSTIRLP
ncbi:hypothetical protein AKJ09_04010 [Labilithrix luteola]|uniref:BNR repeat domain protein n=1 Tax=Labilithrix luteola TaxID=1391654 RepID=A0A0K1PVF2_9BACT|nr:hypothetical protein [Labilithrix luteola]AKU97346.1 hypothetical protein AKJ09_04010 [Labilithrix luteola]